MSGCSYTGSVSVKGDGEEYPVSVIVITVKCKLWDVQECKWEINYW